MKVKAIKTRIFLSPKYNLLSFIKESFLNVKPFDTIYGGLKEKSIIIITSKIVAIWQGRCVKINSVKNKDDLIKSEARFLLCDILLYFQV